MNADDLPIGTRVRPVYPGRPDWVVYRKVDDGPWGWCLEKAGGAIESREITEGIAKGSIEVIVDLPTGYARNLAVAARALLDAVTDTYVSPGRVAAHARLGLAHQNLERLLAANGDLP